MSKPYRIAVLISGDGSTLQSIIDARTQYDPPIEIACVISDRNDAYGLQRAKRADIPTCVITKKQHPTFGNFERALQEAIDPLQVDLIVLAGFMCILSADFVAHYEHQIINIHPSLLPRYPGLHTHQRALEAGDTYHGTSVHIVTADLDEGPLLAQAQLRIAADDTVESLTQRVKQLEHALYPQVIRDIAQNRLKLIQK